MVRRFAHDILATSQRLTSVGVGSVPVWHAAALTHPPLPLKPVRKKSTRDITYVEDDFRLRFFQDFPLEAMRPKVLSERETIARERGPEGEAWSNLEQRSRNPSSEDCIAFATNLHQSFALPLSKAYAIATAQFAHLRAIHEVATRAAYREARAFGAHAMEEAGELARHNKKVENALKSWKPPASSSRTTASSSEKGAILPKKGKSVKASGQVWSADNGLPYELRGDSADRPDAAGAFSGGRKYVSGWEKWAEWSQQRRAEKGVWLEKKRSSA